MAAVAVGPANGRLGASTIVMLLKTISVRHTAGVVRVHSRLISTRGRMTCSS
ncbi:MAG: hypothetical protein ACM3VX_03360 [Bacteroidota bacterium]